MSDDWQEMANAPKDGTPVKFRLEDMDGPYEIEGVWRFLKKGELPSRWYNAVGVELFVLPHSWRLVGEPAQGTLL